jgi:cytochrome c oxidase assembly factor CtaG
LEGKGSTIELRPPGIAATIASVDAVRWSFLPHEAFVAGGLAGVYAIGLRGETVARWRLACFGGGLLLVLAAQVTPLASLATTSLLTAHLLQNVMFAEWAPALIVLGVPPGLAARLARHLLVRALTHPVVALSLWLATYAAWHMPAAYDAALRHQSSVLHVEHASYFVTGLLFWWPVFQDAPHRLSSGAKAAYVVAAFVLASPIGIVLALLSRPVYSFYVDAPGIWGLSDLADQQIAGVTMSVEQAVVFFCVAAFFVLRHLRAEETRATLAEESSQIA